MTKNDVYQELIQMYSIFNVDTIADSLMELMRAQFTPEEADLAVRWISTAGQWTNFKRRRASRKIN